MEIRLLKAKPLSYGGIRDLSSINYIVIHYTGNANDTARGNANYFATSNTRTAGAHYFVDDKEVWQSVPDIYTAWSVGGGLYENEVKTTGGGKYFNKCTNANSISIELCCNPPKEATIENALELVRILMQKYNIPKSNVIRHFDVTGKHCPAYWSVTENNNKRWLTEFWNRIGGRDMTKTETEKICNDMIYKYNEILRAELLTRMDDLKKETKELLSLKKDKELMYNKVEDVPAWAADTVMKCIENGFIQGDGKNLALSYSDLRMIVIVDRMLSVTTNEIKELLNELVEE